MLTVKELREALAKLPDEMPVLVTGCEGGFDRAIFYNPMEFRRKNEAPGGYMGEFDLLEDGWWRDEDDWLGEPFMALLLGRY